MDLQQHPPPLSLSRYSYQHLEFISERSSVCQKKKTSSLANVTFFLYSAVPKGRLKHLMTERNTCAMWEQRVECCERTALAATCDMRSSLCITHGNEHASGTPVPLYMYPVSE